LAVLEVSGHSLSVAKRYYQHLNLKKQVKNVRRICWSSDDLKNSNRSPEAAGTYCGTLEGLYVLPCALAYIYVNFYSS